MVYLREAHPTDGWKMANSQLKDPLTQGERDTVAAQCCKALKLDFPAVADTMDDQTAVDWAAWPERIFVIGVDGRVVYAGQQGPFGFWPTDRLKQQAARRAEKEKPAAKGPDAVLSPNLKGDSLEAFLSRMLRKGMSPESVKPPDSPPSDSPPAAPRKSSK